MVQNKASGGKSQLWSITGVADDGYFKILNVNSGQALYVHGKSTSAGAQINQYPYKDNDPANQLWSLVKVKDTFDGTVSYNLINRKSGKLLDISGSSTTVGAVTVQNAANAQPSQQWTITNLGNGYYKILNMNSGLALEDYANSQAQGATVDQWTPSGGVNQQWLIVYEGNGYYTLINERSDECLDVTGNSTANGASVIQWPYHGKSNEQWSIVRS